MYEQVFQLKKQPFSICPRTEHYFPAKAIHTALSHCKMAIDRATGPAIVVGESGLGKTLLLSLLADDYSDRFHVAHFACSKLATRLDLLQSILFSLDQPFRDMSEGELRLTYLDFLRPHEGCKNGVLLLIDDAHLLNSGLLDELRMLSGIQVNGDLRCHLVLCGNRTFEEALAEPQNDSLNKRIGSRSLLTNFTSTETAEYIRNHLRRAGGGNRHFFTDEALQKIHEFSCGVPRVINQLCDNSLIVCAINGKSTVDLSILNQAWQEIEQFPALWTQNVRRDAPGNTDEGNSDWTVIEFGSLTISEGSANDSRANATTLPFDQGFGASREPEFEAGSAMQGTNAECDSRCEHGEMQIRAEADVGYSTTIPDSTPSEIPEDSANLNFESKPWGASSPTIPFSSPTPEKALASNPFEEAFESEEMIQAEIMANCTRHNQSASKIGRYEIETSQTSMPAMPGYQFDSGMFTDSAPLMPQSTRGNALPNFQNANLITNADDKNHSAKNPLTPIAERRTSQATVEFSNPHLESVTVPFEQMKSAHAVQSGETESQDDRDLLIINRTIAIQPDHKSAVESPTEVEVAPPTAATKGKAVRLDYQELFKLLRKSESI